MSSSIPVTFRPRVDYENAYQPFGCGSPTEGLHTCINCAQVSAHVTAHKWKKRHPSGAAVYGLTPEEHPVISGDNFGWRLFSWVCDNCMFVWFSYKCYQAFDEVLPSSGDFILPSSSLFKSLPRPPASAGVSPDAAGDLHMDDTSSFQRHHFPTRPSSLAPADWAGKHSLPPGIGMPQDLDIDMDFLDIATPEAAGTASASATAEYQAHLSVPDQNQYKHWSTPVFSNSTLQRLEDMADRRRSEPFHSHSNTAEAHVGPLTSGSHSHEASFKTRLPSVPHDIHAHDKSLLSRKQHKRGGNFDHSNYLHMRKMGSCQTCRDKKQKCHESHPRFEVSSSREKAR